MGWLCVVGKGDKECTQHLGVETSYPTLTGRLE